MAFPTVTSFPKSIPCLVGGLFRRSKIYVHVRRAYIFANALIGEPDGTRGEVKDVDVDQR